MQKQYEKPTALIVKCGTDVLNTSPTGWGETTGTDMDWSDNPWGN